MGEKARAVVKGCLLFSAIGWIVLMGGIAAMQSDCGEGVGYPGDAGYLGTSNCNLLLSYAWWILFFQLGVLVFITVALFGTLSEYKGAVLGLLAVVTVLVMDTANTFLMFNDRQVVDKSHSQAAVVGAIMLSMSNVIMLGAIGVHRDDIIMIATQHVDGNKQPPPYASRPVPSGMV